jgi:hypothetical protein
MSDYLNQMNISYLMLMLSCVCSSNRTYEESGALNQLRNLCLWSSLRYATPTVGDIVTRRCVLVPFVTYPICYSFFCPPPLFLTM